MRRPISLEVACALAALYFTFVLNLPFWRRMVAAVAPDSTADWAFLAATAAVLGLAFTVAFMVIGTRTTFKPLLLVLLPATAAASYFMQTYGIVIDKHMIRNAVETNSAEARDLINGGMLLHIGLFGVLPAAILAAWPIAYRPFWREVRRKAILGGPAFVAILALVWTFFMDFSSLFREAKELKFTLTPSNYLVAAAAYARGASPHGPVVVKPFGADAHVVPPAATAVAPPRSITIIVVGETARADHFALNGYKRPTNPGLETIDDLMNFRRVTSCGTDTAHSLPCMFSGVGRAGYTPDIPLEQDDLLDILKRAGLDVVWRENQSGCKGVCARVPTETLTDDHIEAFCADGECHDEILLAGLEERFATANRNMVVVLHMMGSHGPAYYKRVPKAFEKFTPICTQTQFSDCETSSIINAYDNTILYTDHVLTELVRLLKRTSAKGVATSMLYVSDHGESLGENNLYLHGMPFALAPEAQKHVPLLMWLSPAAAAARQIDTACIAAKTTDAISHDNLFHTVLGLNDVATRVYDPALDVVASCRPKAMVEALNPGAKKPPL